MLAHQSLCSCPTYSRMAYNMMLLLQPRIMASLGIEPRLPEYIPGALPTELPSLGKSMRWLHEQVAHPTCVAKRSAMGLRRPQSQQRTLCWGYDSSQPPCMNIRLPSFGMLSKVPMELGQEREPVLSGFRLNDPG